MKEEIVSYNKMSSAVTPSEYKNLKQLCETILAENPEVYTLLKENHELIEVNFLYEVRDVMSILKFKSTPESVPAICKSREKQAYILVFLKHLQEATENREETQSAQDFQKIGLLEEFCHLATRKGDSVIHPKPYWDLLNLYRSDYGNTLIVQLNADQNHYEVYALMLKCYPDGWVKRYSRFFTKQTPTEYTQQFEVWKKNTPIRVCNARLVTDYFRTLNLLFVAEKAKTKISPENKQLLDKLLETGQKDLDAKRSLIIKELGATALTLVDAIDEPIFTTPETFFSAILELWKDLKLITTDNPSIKTTVEAPSSGDRWTEYAATKYTTPIWSATRSGTTPTVTDEANTVLAEANRAGDKCIKVSTTGSTNPNLHVVLNIANTEYGSIDAENRISAWAFALKAFTSGNAADLFYLNLFLYDGDGNKILLRVGQAFNPYGIYQDTIAYHDFTFERQLSIPIGADLKIETDTPFDKWCYSVGSTFDWEHIVSSEIQMSRQEQIVDSGKTWGMYIDALQFVGGQKISQFSILNPPAVDTDSIDDYGIHPFKQTDSQISSFEQAQAEAARLLNNMSNPIPTLTCTKLLPATHLHPSDVVTVAGTDYRIIGVTYNWKASTKRVEATYSMIGKLSSLPQIWTRDAQLRYLMR